ncbi:MAG: DUF3137 domain-containing protein [Prevotella sp.]|jgi:predicted nucleic acid-binding Zn ribbon protein|nr:DUF3137 domain-containing protein [Prevotella sp.]
MTTHRLRELLLQEHRRDKKLVLINYGIICLVAILIISLIAFLIKGTGADVLKIVSDAFGGEENAPAYVKYVFMAVLAGCVLYPFYNIWKLSKRPRQIEDLISRIESGGKAAGVSEFVEHKITIPLLKINLKMCPVTFIGITLSNDTKIFNLPLGKLYIPDAKILLSGGNIQKLNEIRDVLYGDDGNGEDPAEEAVYTPVRPVEEFRVFLDENMKETIEGIDKQRKGTRNATVMLIAIIAIVILGIAGYYIYSSYTPVAAGDYSTPKFTVPFIVIMIVASVVYSFVVKKRYQKKAETKSNPSATTGESFEELVFGRIIKYINPTVEYIPLGHVGLPEFLDSGLFEEKNYDIRGNDQISGRHNGVPFIMCELKVSYKRNFSDEKESPDNVFSGQFFVAGFNKPFTSTVFIKPKRGIKGFFSNDSTDGYTRAIGEKIMLEDPEFMDMFNVYGTDQVEARYILTPALMERIKNLEKRTKGQFYIAFSNSKITVTNQSNSSKFGVGFFSSLTRDNNKLLVEFYENICDQFAIIDDLKLNVKIWKPIK